MKKQLIYVFSLVLFLLINNGIFFFAANTSLTKTYKCTINTIPSIGEKNEDHCQKFFKSHSNTKHIINWTKNIVMVCSILLYGLYAFKLHKCTFKTKKIIGGILFLIYIIIIYILLRLPNYIIETVS